VFSKLSFQFWRIRFCNLLLMQELSDYSVLSHGVLLAVNVYRHRMACDTLLNPATIQKQFAWLNLQIKQIYWIFAVVYRVFYFPQLLLNYILSLTTLYDYTTVMNTKQNFQQTLLAFVFHYKLVKRGTNLYYNA